MDEPTCGTGIAEHAALPAAIGTLLASMADVLDHHLLALDVRDADAAAEHAAYTRVIGHHRDVADRLESTVKEMTACRTLPVAPHRTQVLSTPEATTVFARYVEAERTLLNLLASSVQRDQQMLDDMRQPRED
jgi:hypothetical protein